MRIRGTVADQQQIRIRRPGNAQALEKDRGLIPTDRSTRLALWGLPLMLEQPEPLSHRPKYGVRLNQPDLRSQKLIRVINRVPNRILPDHALRSLAVYIDRRSRFE